MVGGVVGGVVIGGASVDVVSVGCGAEVGGTIGRSPQLTFTSKSHVSFSSFHNKYPGHLCLQGKPALHMKKLAQSSGSENSVPSSSPTHMLSFKAYPETNAMHTVKNKAQRKPEIDIFINYVYFY